MINVGILCVGPANYLSISNAIKKTGNNPILIKNSKIKKKNYSFNFTRGWLIWSSVTGN